MDYQQAYAHVIAGANGSKTAGEMNDKALEWVVAHAKNVQNVEAAQVVLAFRLSQKAAPQKPAPPTPPAPLAPAYLDEDALPEDDMGPPGVWPNYQNTPTLPTGSPCPRCGAVYPTHKTGCDLTVLRRVELPQPPTVIGSAIPNPSDVAPRKAANESEMPGWARELLTEIRLVGQKADLATDSAVTIMEKMTSIANTLKSWASAEKPQPTAPGIGQGASAVAPAASGVIRIVKVKVIPGEDGKIAIQFFDDDPDHKYPEIRETRTAKRWERTLPSGFDLTEERGFKVDWNVTYKLSENTTAKGNRYKDVVSITVNP